MQLKTQEENMIYFELLLFNFENLLCVSCKNYSKSEWNIKIFEFSLKKCEALK